MKLTAYEVVKGFHQRRHWADLDEKGYNSEEIKLILGIDHRPSIGLDQEGRFFIDNEQIEITEGQVPVVINVYRVNRLYGGSEEGGWWYNEYQLHEYQMVAVGNDPTAALTTLNELKQKYNNEGARPLSSVLSDGQWEVYLEFEMGESRTKMKPVYS